MVLQAAPAPLYQLTTDERRQRFRRFGDKLFVPVVKSLHVLLTRNCTGFLTVTRCADSIPCLQGRTPME